MNRIGPVTRQTLEFLDRNGPLEKPYLIQRSFQKHRCTKHTSKRLIGSLIRRNLIKQAPPRIACGVQYQITKSGKAVLSGEYRF